MGRSLLAGFDRSDVWRAIVALLASSVGLGLAGWILPGIAFDGWWPVLLVALVMAVVGLVIRPVLVALATPFGMVGALVLALLGQAIVAYIALSVVPGVHGRLVPRGLLGDLDRRRRRHAGLVGHDGRHERRRLRPPRARRTTGEARCGPGGDRHPVRAARRRALSRAPVGRHGRNTAHLVAVDPRRQPRVHGVDPHAAGDDPRQPDGDPARDHRRHPGLPLGRPCHRAGLRRQQAVGRGRHRGAALRRAGAPRRRRGVGEQPVQR